jgi:hypothetical protein
MTAGAVTVTDGVVVAVSDVTTTDYDTVDPCGCGGCVFPLRLRVAIPGPVCLTAIDAYGGSFMSR